MHIGKNIAGKYCSMMNEFVEHPMKNMRKRNKYIDAAKALACIFVVLIHCMFPGKIGLVFRALARFAVPLFFAVSGYFLGGDRR